jgi:triphosphoribosyl-dephospho-CoA synthetase
MKWGAEACVEVIVKSAIAELGGVIRGIKISRVDLCADLANVRVERFQSVFENGGYVCRARRRSNFEIRDANSDSEAEFSSNQDGHRKTGITLGKSGIIARVYDKLREARFNEDKMILLQQNRWGGEIPESATRVEFELKREANSW